MENPVKKYQLEQDGKNYTLSTQIFQDKLRFVCIEVNTANPLVFTGEFSLNELTQLNTIFLTVSTISQVQDIFDNIVTTKKVSIEPDINSILLKLFVNEENQMEDYFTLKLNSFSQSSQIEQKNETVVTQSIDNQAQIDTQTQSINQYQSQINSQNAPLNLFYSFGLNNNNINMNASNNNIEVGNVVYSSENQIQNPEQYIQTSENNQNILLNSISSNNNSNYNTANSNYSYEKVQKQKVKRTKIDKLTLSLKAIPNKENNDMFYREWMKSLSPQKEEIPENIPIQQPLKITPPVEQNIKIETVTIEKNIEIENLKNENNRLNDIIKQLRDQIQALMQENTELKIKNSTIIKTLPNGNESQEIIFLKSEIEKYIRDNEMLRNKLRELEEYKRIKEEEIAFYKIKIEELSQNYKKIEEYAIQKEKEISELRVYMDELLRKLKMNEFEYQNILRQSKHKEINLEDQSLLIQDTRLEIVKGDIIENAKELEILSRKISKNNRKISFNLLYKATIDGDKAEIFHKKCDGAKSTLVLVRSLNDKRFGGYTTCDWRGNSVEKKDDNAFVFSLDKRKIYDIIPGEFAIGCYPKYGPVFLGCQIRIYDDFFKKGGTTFEKGMNYNTEENYELTGGLKKFEIKDIEVYSVDLE